MTKMLVLIVLVLVCVDLSHSSSEFDEKIPANKRIFLGFSPLMKTKIAQTSQFQCANGGEKLTVERLNDDYCDCADGSDEPGTSACSHTKVTFHCRNVGYFSKQIPTAHVNDGICDCCDGSDEYLRPGFCRDATNCAAEMETYQSQIQDKIAMYKNGLAEKQKLKELADFDRSKTQEEIRVSESELAVKEKSKSTLVEALALLREKDLQIQREQSQKQKSTLINQLALLDFSPEVLSEIIIELSIKASYSEDRLLKLLHTYRPEKQSPLEIALDKYEERKREYVSKEEEEKQRKEREREAAAADSGSSDSTEYESDEDSEVRMVKAIGEDPVKEIFQAYQDATVFTSPETKEKEEQESKLADEISDLAAKIQTANDTLHPSSDLYYGPNGIFFAVRNDCISTQFGQYNYKVCFFKQASQDSTSLGDWNGFNDNFTQIKFTGGQKCWNGPERSFSVKLECGSENSLSGIEEPDTCVYTGTLKTPLVCHQKDLDSLVNPQTNNNDEHDEL